MSGRFWRSAIIWAKVRGREAVYPTPRNPSASAIHAQP